MDKTHIKQKVILSAVAGMILIPGRVLDVSAAFCAGIWDRIGTGKVL